MKLFGSSRSPFVRKVLVAAHEIGLAGRIRTERVVVAANKPNAEVMAVNPLNKIPTLVLDDGTRALRFARDLRVSSTRCTRAEAVPGRSRRALDRAAAPGARRRADGGDHAAAWRAGPPAGKRNRRRICRVYRLKIAATLDRLEREAERSGGTAAASATSRSAAPWRTWTSASPPTIGALGRARLARLVCRVRGAALDASHRVCRRLLRSQRGQHA